MVYKCKPLNLRESEIWLSFLIYHKRRKIIRMENIVFNRETLKCCGFDRSPLQYEFEVKTPYPINLNKTISEPTNEKIQKVNENDEYLYKDNIQTITDEFGNEIETYDETIESEKVIEWDEQTVIYKITSDEYITELQDVIQEDGSIIQEEVQIPIYQEITNVVNVPKTIVKLEPVMIDQMVNKTYTLENGYMNFDYFEALEAKKQSINNNSLTSLIFFDEDFINNDLILSNCSIGDGILIIHPQGSVSTPLIQLPKSKNIIELYQESQNAGLVFYINDVEVTNGRVKLSNYTDKIIIKVVNPTNKNLELYCLGGLI